MALMFLAGCFLDYEKLSQVDAGGLPPHCVSGALDGDESDVDCGGSCQPCALDQRCAKDGDCLTGACVSEWCVTASGPPAWLPAAELPAARSQLAAVAGADGRIYAIGGNGSGGPLAVVEGYAPESNSWTRWNDLTTPRAGLAAVSAAGTLYAIGGSDAAGNVLATVEIADPLKTGGWSFVTPLVSGRRLLSATTGPDLPQIFVMGGADRANGMEAVVGSVEIYTAGIMMWQQVSVAVAAEAAAAVGADGRIYMTGGWTSGHTATPSSRAAMPPVLSMWTPSADMLSARRGHGAASAPDGMIYCIGGRGADGAALATVEAYRPASNRWTPRSSLSAPRAGVAVAVGTDGRIYAIGGEDDAASPLKIVEGYGPVIGLFSGPGSPATSISPGSPLFLSGRNFAANATVEIHVGALDAAPAATGSTDSAGTLPMMLPLHAPKQSGSYRVFAVDNRSQYPVSAPLSVR